MTFLITAATTDGGCGRSSDAWNNAAKCLPWQYRDGAGFSIARAIGVSMMPGSTMATRTPNGFISCASASLVNLPVLPVNLRKAVCYRLI
jgi:hypothetical protein